MASLKGIAASISFPGRQPGISASLWLAIDRGNWFQIRGAMECIGNQIFLPSRPSARRLFSRRPPLSSPFPLSLAPISFRLFSEWRARNRDDGYIFLRNSLLSPPVSGNNPGAQVELSSRAKFLRPGILEERRYRSEAVGWGGWSSNFWNILGVSSRSTRVIDKSRLFTGI